ncbi:MAG: hypothetical protein H7X83_06240 [Verrucomicrobia bacterium]|nr:hypothetical protein [Deltaproteobacteria bacterium]
MFGKKAQLLEEAETTISQQQDQLDRYKRHYEKQQDYIEGLYDVIGDLSRQLGSALQEENLERLQNNPYLEDNSKFFLDLHTLFNSKIKKGQNVTCYFGKDLLDIKRKFQERDFKNGKLIYLTERFTLDDLRKLFKDWMWKKPLEEGLLAIRKERNLDSDN